MIVLSKSLFISCLLFLATTSIQAQVGIGTTTPSLSAQLDVSSTTKGFLPPRMNRTQRNALSAVAGLTIYNTDDKAFQVYNGTAWYSTVHYVGESYGGGIIFHVYDNGQHGLIASTADQSVVRWWGGSNVSTIAKADGMGAGLKNTVLVIAKQGVADGSPYAATVCNEYTVTSGGVTYGDWYLPSKYELGLMMLQKTIIGGFVGSWYYSSTEVDASTAWLISVDGTTWWPNVKNEAWSVRAIRSF